MLGKQHLLFGTVTGIATVITLNQLGVIDETGMYEFTGMAMLGSLLPEYRYDNLYYRQNP